MKDAIAAQAVIPAAILCVKEANRHERIINYPQTWCTDICSHTCKIYEGIYNETINFLNMLSKEETTKLYEILTQYNIWSINYRNNNHNRIDNQDRLTNIKI